MHGRGLVEVGRDGGAGPGSSRTIYPGSACFGYRGELYFDGIRLHSREGALEVRRHRRRDEAGQGHLSGEQLLSLSQRLRAPGLHQARRHALLQRRRRGARTRAVEDGRHRRGDEAWSRTSIPGGTARNPISSRCTPARSSSTRRIARATRNFGGRAAGPSGTRMVKDIRPGSEGSPPARAGERRRPGSSFGPMTARTDRRSGSQTARATGNEAAQGHPSGRRQRLPLPGLAAGVGQHPLPRRLRSSRTAAELWSSNGTTAGTQLVKDIYPGRQRSGDTPTGSRRHERRPLLLGRPTPPTGRSSGRPFPELSRRRRPRRCGPCGRP